jgi:hypothetical protein
MEQETTGSPRVGGRAVLAIRGGRERKLSTML